MAFIRYLSEAELPAERQNDLISILSDPSADAGMLAIVAYFAFVNRLADGLGVELE